MASKRRVYFPKLKYPIKLSKHAELRLKQRAGLNSKKKRSEFMKKASREVMTLSDIPRSEEFRNFIFYLRQVYKNVRKKNIFCMLYFYQKYIFIISVEGIVVTFLTMDSVYEGEFDKIIKFRNYDDSEQSVEEQDRLNSETSG